MQSKHEQHTPISTDYIHFQVEKDREREREREGETERERKKDNERDVLSIGFHSITAK